MIRSLVRSSVVVSAVLAAALVGTSVAYAADELVADGDGAVPVSANALTYGTVCKGAPGSRNVALALRHGGGNNVFADGATVTYSAVSAPAGVTVGSLGQVKLPADWTTLANGTYSAARTGVVTIDTSAVRTYSGSVTFRATGAKDGGGTLTRDGVMSLSASVVACDSTPPVLTLPGPMTVQATGASGAVVTYTATATDAVDGPRPVSCSPASGTTFGIRETTVTCSSSDSAGNTATGSFTVTVVDTAGPVLTLPASRTVEATGPAGATQTYAATATDAVDGSRPVTCSPASGSTFALGSTTVTCSATDTRGNTSTGSFTVAVRDTAAPTLTLPSGIAAEATGPAGATVTYAASASDTVDTDVPVSCDHPSGGTFPLGATVVTCTASDDSGNGARGTFTVSVGDTRAPSVNVPGPVTVEAAGPGGAVATYAVTAHDAVDGDLVPACAPASGTTFALGTTTVSCTATDAARNTAGATFDVRVLDRTPPALTVPGDLTAEATSAAGAVVGFTASASDLVDGDVVPSCPAPAVFPLGTTTVTCTAVDAAGNSAMATFDVTVSDTTAPRLTLPGTITAEATGADGAGVTYDATASDAVSGDLAPSCAPVSGAVFRLGRTTVTCTAADAAGNRAEGAFDVVVRDTRAPVLNAPAGIVEEATAPTGALVTWIATASDAVDGTVPVACSPASGSRFALGGTEVECTATDAARNTDVKTFTVVVQDTTAPVVGVPAAQTVEATGPDGATVEYAATATDAVSSVTPACAPGSGTTFALGTRSVACTATDAAGNTGRASFTVTVRDTTPPALTLPADQLVEATGPDGAAATWTATARDLVSGAVAVTCDRTSGATFALGTHTVGCAAADAAGNRSTGSFTVTVEDTTAPELTLPDNVVEEAGSATGNVVTYAATARDVVSGTVAVTCAPASGTRFAIATTAVSCAAADAAGNEATGGFTVTVRDKTAPAVTVPDNVTVEATGPNGRPHTFRASAHDVVDGDVATSCVPASGSVFPLGVTTVRCAATDAAGNTGTGGFTVTVEDTTAPVVTVPADRTVEATGPAGAVVTYAASASDAVSGSPAVRCGTASGATFALGATTVTCTATDAAGNTGSASFVVTVVDTTAPAVTVPSGVTEEATGASGAVVTYASSASDAVSGAVATACNPASGTTYALGATPVTCTATDAAGNTGSASFTVRVTDTRRPSLTLPADFAVTATTATGAVVTYATSSIDVVSGSVPVVCAPASGAAFPLGSTAVGCSATDEAGNTATGTFTVSVRYAFSGFQQPVNDTRTTGAAQSRYKLGSTIPLKFTLGTLGSASVQQAGAPAFARTYRGATCDTSTAAEAPPAATTTTGTVYRWDETSQQYVFNFSTKGLASGEWRVWALTADGAEHYVDLCLTK